MFNVSDISLSLKGTPSEQVKAIVEFIDKLLDASCPAGELLPIRTLLTSPEAQELSVEAVDTIVWRELQSALPDFLYFELFDEDAEVKVFPDLDNLLDYAKPDLGSVMFIKEYEAWPDVDTLHPGVRAVVREWWNSNQVELFDCATRRAVWTYTFPTEAQKAI